MYKKAGKIIYSPNDLVTFMTSSFASWMDRSYIESPTLSVEPDEVDELGEMLAEKGGALEKNLLEQYVAQGKKVTQINSIEREDKYKATLEAIRNQADVIYQACLKFDNFYGYADFLIRSDEHNCYEVLDTKLALNPRPEFIIQLCAYADMLKEMQDEFPEQIHVVTGDLQQHSFKTKDYFYYYLALKEKFLQSQNEFDHTKMPDPFDSPSHGRWSDYAKKLLQESDHLSKIANITKSQVKKLNKAGINTCQQLIESKLTHVTNLNDEKLTELKAQAEIQKLSEGLDTPKYEVRHHQDDAKIGLALLPPHSDLDVFFDIEGFPMIKGGLEYLWGCTYFNENKKRDFIDFWAHDSQQEKQAFADFINWVYARWQKDPKMHIYHYASYEITACRKIMGRYGICEYEVDQLLRNEVFVDLYKIVKNSLRIGEPAYSIKNVEHLYRGSRQTEVGTGGDSIVVYEKWREKMLAGQEGDTWQTSEILRSIRDYNIDDCNSTQELTDWLRERQSESNIAYLGTQEVKEPEVSDKVKEAMSFRDKLLQEVEDKSDCQSQLFKNFAWFLEFHHRESKPVFWKLFDRLGQDPDDLYYDIDCLAQCKLTSTQPYKLQGKRSLCYEYAFPPDQEFRGLANSYYIAGQINKNGKPLKASLYKDGTDIKKGLITLSSTFALPNQATLVPDEFVSPGPIPDAINDVVARMIDSPGEHKPILTFLTRQTPDICKRKNSDAPIISSTKADERLGQAIEAVKNLNNSCITIQGPPGSGKTYTASRIIAALLKENKTVAITSNSHKAINNLLVKTAQYCKENGISKEFICTKNTGDEIAQAGVIVASKNADICGLYNNSGVVGATAWGFCREELIDEFDYLFVDEAGQVSVANLVGMSRCARNLVLLGDQMQLGQPTQAIHPEDSGLSVLDYLMKDQAIIAPEMGIFLSQTYRMHSLVNEPVSQAIYEGMLRADPLNNIREIEVPADYVGYMNRKAGLIYVPVEHEGNSQYSKEEIDVISICVSDLLDRTFTDKSGAKHKLDWEHMLFVAPYNFQVNRLKEKLGEKARIGTVDKFQGQEAPVVFFSMCSSDANETPRGMGFLFDKHRLNVAISRAQTLAVIVGHPSLSSPKINSLDQMKEVNIFARFISR